MKTKLIKSILGFTIIGLFTTSSCQKDMGNENLTNSTRFHSAKVDIRESAKSEINEFKDIEDGFDKLKLTQARKTINNGIVAYYPFSGNANDATTNGHDGKVYGGVSLTSDRFGNNQSAYDFDGVTGYIDVPSLNTIPYSPITYSSWIWINSYLPTNLGFQFKSIVGRNTDYILNTGEIGLFAGYGLFDNTLIMWRGGGANGSGGMQTISPSSIIQPLLRV